MNSPAPGRFPPPPSGFELRQGTADDFPAVLRMDGVAFGADYSSNDVADIGTLLDPTSFLLAFDGGRLVGATAAFALSMTVPGGVQLAVPGVTWVSVAVTHRRRGIVRALMDRQLSGYAGQGATAAVLNASQGGIYQRFGYGPATSVCRTTVDRRVARLAEPGDSRSVQVMTAHEAATILPQLRARWQAITPGAIDRGAPWWTSFLADRAEHRSGGTALVFLVHPDGYLAYRARDTRSDAHSALSITIVDYAVIDAGAHRALWQVLLSMDLFGEISSDQLPADDPLLFALTDPRQVRTTEVADGLWLRLLDVPTALAARTYGVEIDVVIGVRDVMLGDARYRLVAGPDGATCARTDSTPDLHCDVGALGSVYLGGHRLGQLLAAGRAQMADPVLARRTELAFLADRAPMHGTSF